jgi:hypothetical protein
VVVQQPPNLPVGVRFSPPGPTLFSRSLTMKYFRVGLPIAIVLLCVFNVVAAYGADNSLAVSGYWMAFCGWAAVAFDEYLTFRRENRSV